MSTLMGAVELSRGHEHLPASGAVGVRDLLRRFQPSPLGSMRALLLNMFGNVSLKRPWAVILCRFKGSPPDASLEEPIANFYRGAFTPGSGGLVEYWRDASLGAIDITGSRVFGWIEIEIPRSKAGGAPDSMPPGPGRAGLLNYAVNAVKRQEGSEALNGFLGPIAVYTQNWSKDDVPADATWATPGFYHLWIDGSSQDGIVCLTPPHDGNITAHEMGHVFRMNHDLDSDLQTDYKDPCCIMSQNGPFIHPTWKRNFGPAICLPHLMQRDWMYKRRVHYDNGDWQSRADGITLELAPISSPIAHANLGIKLAYSRGDDAWDYYLEFVTPTEWNQGVPGAPYVFIRRMAPKYGGTPAYLGFIQVPTAIGRVAEFVEPSGNVRFQVQRFSADSRIVKVQAKKL